MKKIKYFIFAILSFLLISIPTNAYVNTDTSFNIDVDYRTMLESRVCGGVNAYEYIDWLTKQVDWSTSYYQLFIAESNIGTNDIYFYLQPSSYFTQYNEPDGYTRNLNIFGYNANYGGYSHSMWFRPSYDDYYGLVTFYYGNTVSCSNVTDVYNDSLTLWLLDVFQNGYRQGGSSSLGYYTLSTSLQGHISRYQGNYINYNNNTSYDFNYYYIYSSRKLLYYDGSFNANNNINNTSKYYKKVCLVNENKCYEPGDYFDSYMDLHPIEPEPVEPTFIGYKESLDTFYTDLSPSDFTNYQLSVNFKVPQSLLGFYQEPQDYIDNTTFNAICSGRINNSNNYYTYDNFPCSFNSGYSLTDSQITYTFNSFTTSSSLTNYDKLYITINSNYLDSNVSTVIFDFNYTYNLGNFYNTQYRGSIYEKFTNLPLNFRMYLTSNNSLSDSDLYLRSFKLINYNIYLRGFSTTTYQQNLAIGNSLLANIIEGTDANFEFYNAQVSNSIDTGIMIFQQNGSILVPYLDLFFNSGVILSINNNSSSNDFYYIDNTGNITHNDFIINIQQNNNNYDISYYISVVNDFIDNLSSDTLEFASLTQNFYNNIPLIFQTFIFVIFIIFCLYFTYLLIKK